MLMKITREKRMIQTMFESLSELLALSNLSCVRLKLSRDAAVLGCVCLSSGIIVGLCTVQD